jgi:hypothetical protein
MPKMMMPALIYQLAGCMKTFVCRLLPFQQPGEEEISQLIWMRPAGIVDE